MPTERICGNPDCTDPSGAVEAVEVWIEDADTGEEVARKAPELCEGCRRELIGLPRRRIPDAD